MITRSAIRGPRYAKKGFTLLEVLIAVIILAAGAIAIVKGCNTIMTSASGAEDAALAVYIAQAKMEGIRNTAFASIANISPAQDPNFPGFTVAATVSGADPKQVDVTVTWSARGGQAGITLTTLRTQP